MSTRSASSILALAIAAVVPVLSSRALAYTQMTWTFNGVAFNDGGTLNGSAVYNADNSGRWTWDITTTGYGAFHYTSTTNEFEYDTFQPAGGSPSIEFVTTDYAHQIWFYTYQLGTFAPFFANNADTFDLSIPGYHTSLQLGGQFVQYVTNGTLSGVAFTPPPPPPPPPIDLNQSFYTATNLNLGKVTPEFKGGTLRIDAQSFLEQNFIIDAAPPATPAAGNAIVDTNGNYSFFLLGSISGAGNLTITDSAYPLNNSNSPGIFILDEAAYYLGSTTITSGAIVKLVSGKFLPNSTDLTLNGLLQLNSISQTVASLAGTDPTASVTLGSFATLTVKGNANTTYAGSISDTSFSTLLLTGNTTLTLTGAFTLSGFTETDPNATLTFASTTSTPSAGYVYNTGTLILAAGTAVNAASVSNSGIFLVKANATLTTPTFSQSTPASTLLNNGAITAPTVTITAGTFGGNGTITGNVTLSNATLQVGASPDALHIAGNLTQTSGTISFEIDPDGHGGFLVSTLFLDPASTLSISNTSIRFDFKNGANPLAFFQSGAFNFNTFLEDPSGHPLSTDLILSSLFQNDTFTADSTTYTISNFAFSADAGAISLNQAVATPEPASLSVLALPLFALARRRRS